MYGHVDQTFQQSITVVKMILYVHASLVTPQLCCFVSFSPPFRHDLRNSKGVFQCFFNQIHPKGLINLMS